MGSDYLDNKEFERIIELFLEKRDNIAQESLEIRVIVEREFRRKKREKRTTSKRGPQKGLTKKDWADKKEKEKLLIEDTIAERSPSIQHRDPILCECLAQCFYLLAENIIRAFRFSLVDEEDAKQEAVMVCLKKIERFERARGKAFNYFTTMILNHYRQLYRSARNYQDLKGRFLEKELLSIPTNLRKGISAYGNFAPEDE